MDNAGEDFYGKFPVEIETTVIPASATDNETLKSWYVWRFDRHAPWWRRWLTRIRYELWCAWYIMRHWRRPCVLEEHF